MDIIAVNGQGISLGRFINLHAKTVGVRNGLFVKINKYYASITFGQVQLMHSNDLCLLVIYIQHFMVCCQLTYI